MHVPNTNFRLKRNSLCHSLIKNARASRGKRTNNQVSLRRPIHGQSVCTGKLAGRKSWGRGAPSVHAYSKESKKQNEHLPNGEERMRTKKENRKEKTEKKRKRKRK
jgi:hypothetical protein